MENSRRKWVLFLFIVLYLFSYYGWILYWKMNDRMLIPGGNAFSTFAPLLSSIWLFLAWKKEKVVGRPFWFLLFLGALSFFTAEVIWDYYENHLKINVPYPGYADIFYMLQIFFYFSALTYQLVKVREKYKAIKTLLGMAITMTVAATFSWSFFIKPILEVSEVSPLFMLVSLGTPVGDLALFLGILNIYVFSNNIFQKKSMKFIMWGLLIQVFADTFYLYMRTTDTYISGSFIDPLYPLSVLLVGLAGLRGGDKVKHKELKQTGLFQKTSFFVRFLLPYLAVALLFLFIAEKGAGDKTLVVGSEATIVLIILRQVAILIDNHKLLKQYGERTRELTYSEQRYSSLFHNHPDAVFSVNLEGIFTSSNEACQKLLGLQSYELAGRHFLQIVSEQNREVVTEIFSEAIKGYSKGFEIQLFVTETIASFTIVPIIIENQVTGVFGIAKDITDNKRNEEKIRNMAYNDLLTGLPNRRMIEKVLNEAVSINKNDMHGIMFIDLDRFNIINDTLGHTLGDQLLHLVGGRLKGLIATNEVVGRQGGAEFVLFSKGIKSEEDALMRAEKVLQSLRQPFHVNGHELLISASIGISIYPMDGLTGEELLKNADIAMYRVKENGKNGYAIYSPSKAASSSRRLELENDLYYALKHGQFLLHYQPQIDSKEGRIVGAEALLRWNHPQYGFISPAEFIPIAEETGSIVPISEWVLKMACLQAKKWKIEGINIKVGVNLSPRHFYQKNMIHTVKSIIAEIGIEPGMIDLEITEGIAAKDRTLVNNKLSQLRDMGISISVDDFGTGYSSLSYLTNFPIDTLKIAREFVVEIGKDYANEAIISSIITMANNLGLDVIAEGVETEQQSAFLQVLGCSRMQGYLYGKPSIPSDIEKMMREPILV